MIFIKLYSIGMSNCFRKAKNAIFFHSLSGSLWLNLRNIWFFIKGHYYGDICIHSWIIKDEIMCTKSDINSILQFLSVPHYLSRSSISRHETNSILRVFLMIISARYFADISISRPLLFVRNNCHKKSFAKNCTFWKIYVQQD